MSISPEQIKAARRLLEWRQFEIAQKVKVSLNTIAYIESGRRIARASTLDRIKSAFETAGVEFGVDGIVRLRKPTRSSVAIEELNASNDK